MGKRLIWYFIFFVASVSIAFIFYVQSQGFANIFRKEVIEKMAKQVGVSVVFDRLSVDIFPPGLSLVNVKINVSNPHNSLGLGFDTFIQAEKLGIVFRMVQAFSRGITINKFYLKNAIAKINLNGERGRKKSEVEQLSKIITRPIKFQITEDLFVYIRQLELRDTELKVVGNIPERGACEVSTNMISYLSISPESKGTGVIANLEKINFLCENKNATLNAINLNADLMPQQIKIHSLDIQKDQVASHVEGKLHGNVDKIENMKIELQAISRASLKDLLPLLNVKKMVDGQLYAELRIAGEIKRQEISGKLRVDRLRYSMWEFDKISTDVMYSPGRIALSNIAVEKSAGILGVKRAEFDLPLKSFQKNFELEFKKMPLHDFAGDLNKSINNLQAVISGVAKLSISYDVASSDSKLKSLNFQPKLLVENFVLNNQIYSKIRPNKNIISVKKMEIGTNVQYQDGEVNFSDSSITLSSGKILFTGKVSKNKVYDILGKAENIDLKKELEHIAEIPVEGAGALQIHVRGKPENLFLDFNLDLQGAKYVNFDFGRIAGKFSLDDDKSILSITNMQAKKNDSPYTLTGTVDIGSAGNLNLDAQFSNTKPDDLFAIFAKQIEKIKWIPHGMAGQIQGNLHVGGRYDDWENNLLVDANLQASKLSYSGELINTLKAHAGFSKGTYFAKNIEVEKFSLLGRGEIYYYHDDRMKYNFNISRGKIRDFNFISALELPLDATITGGGSGEGYWETLKSRAEFSLGNGFVRTSPLPKINVSYDTEGSLRKLLITTNEKNHLLNLKINGNENEKSEVQIDLSNSNYSYFLCLLNKRLCADQALQLVAQAKLSADWMGNHWENMSGYGEIQQLLIAKNDLKLKTNKTEKFILSNGFFNLPRLEFSGEDAKLSIESTGRVDGKDLKIKADGNLPLKVVEFLTSLVEETKGRLDFHTSLYGNLDKIQLSGNMGIMNGFLRFSGLDAAAENLAGSIRFFSNRAQVDSINGSFGGGSLSISGFIDLFLNRSPIFNLDLALKNNRAKFFPLNFAEVDEGKLTLTGNKPPYLFGGQVRIRHAVMRSNFDADKKGRLRTSRYFPEKINGSKSFYEVKIRANAENGVVVDNDLLNAEFRGEVTLLNNFEFPQLIGRAELLKGKLLFRNAAFNLDHAFVKLASAEVFDPQFSIGGSTSVDIYKINLFSSGTISDYKITFSSSPSLPQEDILSLLAFGFRGEDAKKVSNSDMSAITYSEVGVALMDQLRLSKDLQSKGVRVTVAPSFQQSEASIIRPSTVGSDTAAPKVLVQSQLFKNLDATLGSTVGSSQSQELNAGLEYKLSKKASINAVYDQASSLEAKQTTSSYGADLKFHWGFK